MSHRSVYRFVGPRSSQHAGRCPGHLTSVQKRALKRATLRDCGRRCVYCGTRLELDSATLDHVVPLSRGGNHAPGNVVSACVSCNLHKADLLPSEFFARYPLAGQHFMRFARAVHRQLKRGARRAVSLALAQGATPTLGIG